ncbi:hypothetical protein C475_05550 [Halosimplex carlsbadense 2-9-1]|uniref:Uncharacterized protein n=1 Tax=Halosimplex carlsbadense 2-9-1 TaxID=797114 RepID=M0CYE8_9EURY|nr:hypothetical protein [Halosimplex carlsbadense]ELZ28245.1 hypothetical protein C475_05550 [Halosimplex carlsbadense 2-9-1]
MYGLTRRRLLAVAGAAALGGCGGLGTSGEGEPTPLDATAVATAVSGSLPAVTEPFPVLVAPSHFAGARRAVRSTLGVLPEPIPSTGPPDEGTRTMVERSVEYTRESLSTAGNAETARERLDDLRDARFSAERAAATWAFATDELSREAVRSRALTLERQVAEFREDRALVGDPADPVRALLANAIVESLAEQAGDDATPQWDDYERASSDAPTAADAEAEQLPDARAVGERAGTIAEGRARLADARHVDEQFSESLTDASSMGSTFADASESLTATLESDIADLPDPDVNTASELVGPEVGDIGRSVESALRQLHGDAHYLADRDATADPASAVLGRYEGIAMAGAFLSLRERVVEGDELDVDGAADLRERRDEAVTAVGDALETSADERLARELLAYPVAQIASTDASLREWDQPTLQHAAVTDRARYYVEFAALARATPDAVDETLAALDAA